MIFGIAQHACEQFGVAFISAIDRRKAHPKPLVLVPDGPPRSGLRRGITFLRQLRTGQIETPVIGKMRVDRVPLNTGPLRNHADCRKRRPHAAVQIDGGFDDALRHLD